MKPILKEFADKGIVLFLSGEKIGYKAPKGVMTSDILEDLKRNKAKIIAALKSKSEMTFDLTPIQNAYLVGRMPEYELGNVCAHYYTEYDCEGLDMELFKKAVQKAAKLYDVFNLVIYKEGKQCVIQPDSEYEVEVHKDCSREELLQLRKQWSRHDYPLGTWPMIHIIEAGYDKDKVRLYFSFDCMLLDGWSAGMLVQNIFKLYDEQVPEACGYTFQEYVTNLRPWLQENVDQTKAEAYWEERVKTMPKAPSLPYQCPLKTIKAPRVDRLRHDFTKEETDKLQTYIKKHRLTLAAVLATCFMKALAQYSSEKEMTINLTLFNRYNMHPDVPKILGDFTNVGLCSYIPDQDENFEQEVKAVQQQFWELVKYRNYNGVKILGKLAKDDQYKAVMPVVFTCMYQSGREKDHFPKGFREVYSLSKTPQVVLDCQVNNPNEALMIAWDYVVQAFDKVTLEKMFDQYITYVKGLMQD